MEDCTWTLVSQRLVESQVVDWRRKSLKETLGQHRVFCYNAVAEEQHCSCLGHGPGTGCGRKVGRNRMAFSSTKTDSGYVEDSLEQH